MPSSFVAGTTVKYTVTHDAYPANDGWGLVLYMAGVNIITPVTGSATGRAFLVTLTSTITAALGAGNYQWREVVTKSGESYIAASGVVTVAADIMTASAGSMQAWEEKALAVVEAALLGRLNADQQSFQIAGRAVTKIPIAELLEIRAKLRGSIAAQSLSGQFGREVRVQFTGTERENQAPVRPSSWPPSWP